MRSRTSGRRPMSGGATWRRVRVLAADAGIGLIETLIALLIFSIVSTALIGVLVSATSSTKTSKDQTIAEEGAASEIEMIKNWAATPDPNAKNSPTYDDIGTNPVGNPYGLLPQSQAFSGVNAESLGTPAHMKISVSYASANVPGAYTNGVDYKKVTVTITRDVDSKVLSKLTAFVAPPQRPAGNTATISVLVADVDSKAAVPGATVALGTGPSAPRSDTSDSLGNVTFAGLTANPTSGSQAYYDLTVTPPTGYVVDSDYVSPNAAAHFQVSPSQPYSTTLYLYQPVTAAVTLLNSDGTQYTGNASVTLTSSRGSKTLAYTGTPLTFTALSNGELLIPGLSYTVSATQTGYATATSAATTIPTGTYPTNLSSSFSLTMARQTGTLTVTVKGGSRGTTVCGGKSVTVSGGPTNLTGTSLTTPTSGSSKGIVAFSNLPVTSVAPYYTVAVTGQISADTTQTVSASGTSVTITLSTSTSCS